MELIQHNLPVTIDGIHVCVRIRELVGECDEIWVPDKIVDTAVDDNSTNKNDTDGEEDTDDDEDLDYDGSDCDIFNEDFQNDAELLSIPWVGDGFVKTRMQQRSLTTRRHTVQMMWMLKVFQILAILLVLLL
jgi:hypothetical protein